MSGHLCHQCMGAVSEKEIAKVVLSNGHTLYFHPRCVEAWKKSKENYQKEKNHAYVPATPQS